jgi:REP-associated tyrosine transposase
MPRKRRGWQKGACYHITHRCHNREFLFHYAKYRNFYIRTLFKAVQRYHIDVLDYIVTSNHVHLLIAAKEGTEISDGLRYLHGRIGQWHNSQKETSGSFWSDRFHSTRIQDGAHLARCLLYIDLNMVRAGVVDHPAEWTDSAYRELTGQRQRCRIINMPRLLNCLAMKDEDTFRRWHERVLNEKLTQKNHREAYWSNAVAVGEKEWLEQLVKNQRLKRHVIIEKEESCYLQG